MFNLLNSAKRNRNTTINMAKAMASPGSLMSKNFGMRMMSS